MALICYELVRYSLSNAIVLTGGIGTGKSTTSKILTDLGYEVIDADKISKEQFDKKSSEIMELFGTLDRKAIAKIIFSDTKMRTKLEQLLHPAIKDAIMQRSKELDANGNIYFVDIPLFFETKNYPFTKSLLIYTPREVQIERIVSGRLMDRADAVARVDAQMDIELKKPLATWVIDNSGTVEELKVKIKNFLEALNK